MRPASAFLHPRPVPVPASRPAIVAAFSIVIVAVVFLAPRALAVPGEATNLAWCPGTKNCVQWSPAAGATSYRIYRGEAASLGCDVNPHLDSCRDAIVASTTTGPIVTETPAPGRFYWYLVTAADGTGEGGFGNATSGSRQVSDTGVCGASCSAAGAACSGAGDCCSTSCIGGHCQGACCVATSGACAQNADCCSGTCSAGVCTATCATAADCPGTDTACRARTCNAGVCGVANVPGGTVVASTPGDCHANVCDGGGNLVNTIDDSDVPADDGSQCTGEICTNGTPSHPTMAPGSSCSQNGGHYCDGSYCVECLTNPQCPGQFTVCASPVCFNTRTCGYIYAPSTTTCQGGHCDGAGSCVQCTFASDCPGTDTACGVRTCQAGMCGVNNTPSGTIVTSPTGDCHRSVCDGSGNTNSVVDDTDVPLTDGNQCTNEACSAGVPGHPSAAAGTPCSQSGGTVCNSSGSCVAQPTIAATTPVNGTSAAAATTISVTFTLAMNPATLTAQTASGPCSGSIQLSADGFASCAGFSSAAPAMSGGNTTATLTPQPGLLLNRTYKIRVTAAVASASGGPMPSTFTQASGFTTLSPNLCDGSLVISQVYGGGGLLGAPYRNDFVELHNRGTVAASVAGLTIQYSGPGSGTWTPTTLTGTIAPGGYYLIQFASGGLNGASLPASSVTGSSDLSTGSGKIALVASGVALSGVCPVPNANIIDFVGYGSAGCSEGGAGTPSASATTSVQRLQNACADIDLNGSDFIAGSPAPRNGASTAVLCACNARNESNAPEEADFCAVQFPASLNVQAGTTTPAVYGRIYEPGVTETAGPSAGVRAQLGYGPASANPEYQSGWTWVNASYNVQVGNNDEYQATFTAPATGSYRYVYRFSVDQGVSWTYCDTTQGDGGSGANPGLTFDVDLWGILTTTP